MFSLLALNDVLTHKSSDNRLIKYKHNHYLRRTKHYMVMSRDENAGQNGYIQIGNKSFETVEQFKYLGTTLTNQNSIHEEIERRLKSGNACYHSVQNLLSSRLLSKLVKIKIYRTIILQVVSYSCKSWSLTLSDKCRLRVFENKVLRRP
jgi:hypothetical protein